jgi:hypothetical protein
LSDLGDLASTLTAVAAAGAWLYFVRAKVERRVRLEKYLRSEMLADKSGKEKLGRRSVLNAMAYCGMTEAEVLDAGFRSKLISTVPRTDWGTGFASGILLEYTGKP